jgi:hypothetical protein
VPSRSPAPKPSASPRPWTRSASPDTNTSRAP